MELKNINVIQGQASTFQGFGCAVCWSEMVKKIINKCCAFISI